MKTCLCGCGEEVKNQYVHGHNRLGIARGTSNTPSLLGKGLKLQVGYVMVKKRNHHRADKQGYVKRAVLNYEEYYGVIAPSNMAIHHIDGDKTNDDPRNLVLLDKREHDQLYQGKHKTICVRGHKLEYPNLTYVFDKRYNSYSSQCKKCNCTRQREYKERKSL